MDDATRVRRVALPEARPQSRQHPCCGAQRAPSRSKRSNARVPLAQPQPAALDVARGAGRGHLYPPPLGPPAPEKPLQPLRLCGITKQCTVLTQR